jgi:hypothetical protein
MPIEEVKQVVSKTVFSIYEPQRYGPGTKYPYRTLEIPHDERYRLRIPVIEKLRVENPQKNSVNREEVEKFSVPGVGEVFFIKSFDTECSSATYCHGAHDVLGPYILQPILSFDQELQYFTRAETIVNAAKPMMEAFAKPYKGFELETKVDDTGHVFGEGRSTVKALMAKVNGNPALSITSTDAYTTTSDDFMDYGIRPRIHMELSNREFYPIFLKASSMSKGVE